MRAIPSLTFLLSVVGLGLITETPATAGAPDFFLPEGGRVGLLTLEVLADEGPELSECSLISQAERLALCLEVGEELVGHVYDLLLVDLATGTTRNLGTVVADKQPDEPKKVQKAIDAVNEAIELAKDWERPAPLLEYTFNEPMEVPPPVELTAGISLVLDGRKLSVVNASEAVASAGLEARHSAGDNELVVYWFSNSPFVLAAITEHTPGSAMRQSRLELLRLSPPESTPTPELEPCPKDASCSANHAQLYPFLERFCDGRFDEGDLLRLGDLVRSKKLGAEDLRRLFNLYGAMTRYVFKTEELSRFFYGAEESQSTSWLPAACQTAIGDESLEPSAEQRRLRKHVKRLYETLK